jgi:endonuclease YncB( thermonuclease family)
VPILPFMGLGDMMRPAVALGAVASIALLCVGIVAGGRHLSAGDTAAIAVDQIDPDMLEQPEPDAAEPDEESDSAAGPPASQTREPAQDETAGYQRIEPRKPLSDLGEAQRPKPKAPDDFDGATLFRPVTNTAGTFEAMGYAVTVAGIDAVEAGEVCSFKGESWPCGVRARAAFRAFLRGRAVTCAMPPEVASGAVSADCRIGKENVGEWLVENGWARAVPDGPYAEVGDKARSAAKGIFGPPPRSLD